MPNKKRKKFNPVIPPCPGNPEDHILVKGQYGYHWRHKRGTFKEATLNEVMTLSSDITRPTNEAAKRVLILLSAFTQYMHLGHTNALIAGAFKKIYLRSRKIDFSLLEGMEFQEAHPFSGLCKGGITSVVENGTIDITVQAG